MFNKIANNCIKRPSNNASLLGSMPMMRSQTHAHFACALSPASPAPPTSLLWTGQSMARQAPGTAIQSRHTFLKKSSGRPRPRAKHDMMRCVTSSHFAINDSTSCLRWYMNQLLSTSLKKQRKLIFSAATEKLPLHDSRVCPMQDIHA